MEFNSEDEEDVDIDQFCELYAGISYMFEIAEDEHDNNESEQKKKEDITEEPYGFLTRIWEVKQNTNNQLKLIGFI